MILLLLTLGLFLLIGMPVFVAIGASSIVYILFYELQPLVAVQQMFNAIDNFILLALPFFILAGNLMNAGNITDRIFGFANNLIGHVRGGLGHVNIVASVIFAGMSGTAAADAGGLGTVELKAMKDAGYDTPFSVGITAASSTLGPIIPPSLPMIVYGAIANVSVGKLFIAGFLPGILVAICLHAQVYYLSVKRNYPRSPRATWRQILKSFKESFAALLTPVIILFGVVAGIFTPTEAAVVAAIYSAIIAAFVYRSLNFKEFIRVVRDSFETTAVIMIVVSSSILFGWILVRENAASQFTQALLSMVSKPWQVIIILNVLLLILGMFMETITIILIFTPLVTPALMTYGIDLVQFGLILVLNVMIGLMTPPIGLLLFIMAKLANMDLMETFKACAPFLVSLFVTLILISMFPKITLFLPGLIYR
jgi:tripartite ATP-independent transporter DctM subunit